MPGLLHEVGLCRIDLIEANRWFDETLALRGLGGARCVVPLDGGTATEAIIWWREGGADAPLIGLYQFSDPLSELPPSNHTPLDRGIVQLAFHVDAFDDTIARMTAFGTPPIAPTVGKAGDRRAWVRNPDGIFIESMESASFPTARAPGRGGIALCRVTIASDDPGATAAALKAILPASEGESASGGQRFSAGEGGEIMLIAAQAGAPRAGSAELPRQGASGWRSAAGAAGSSVGPARTWSRRMVAPPAQRCSTSGPALYSACSAAMESHRQMILVRPRPLTASTFVARPPLRVWEALNDHETMPGWLAAEKLELITPGAGFEAGYGAVRILDTFGRRVV
jgi:hypothetical protein